jgi:hypothetical protein
MDWNSDATTYKLILSAFLQDISLDSIALIEICNYKEFLEKKSQFSSIEIKKYLENPIKAAELLSFFQGIPPDIDRILIEQQEMPDGNGFPRKLNANQLDPLTCVFILSGILARYVLRDGSNFEISHFITDLESQGYSRGNFKKAFETIRSMKKI